MPVRGRRGPLVPLRLAAFSVITSTLCLLALEGALRVGGVAGAPDRTTTWFHDHVLSPPFMEAREAQGGALRWMVPHAASHFGPFAPLRPEGALRIAVFGGSAAHGYGVLEPAAWPHRLEQLLQSQIDDRVVEVINFGTIAWGSQQMLWAARQIWDHGPWDLVIVYEGHNELLELSAWKSYLPPGEHRQLMGSLLLQQRLEGLRTFAGLRRILQRAGATKMLDPSAEFARRALGEGADPDPGDPIPARKLPAMRLLPKEERARIGAEERRYAARTWRHNVGKIVTMARERGVPVVLVVPPANDFQDPNWFPRTGPEGVRFTERVEAALALRREGRIPDALAAVDEALALFSDPRAVFLKAGLLVDAGRREEARPWLDLARASAEYPNRIVPEVADTIRSFAGEDGVLAVVDAEGDFRARDRDGLIEYRLVYDHCHPSVEGAWRVAAAVGSAVLEHGLAQLPPRSDPAPALDSVVEARYGEPFSRTSDDPRLDEFSGLDYGSDPPRYIADFQGDRRLIRQRLEARAAADGASAQDWDLAGVARFLGGDVDGAFAAWMQALAVDPEDCATLRNRALAWKELGRWLDAREDARRAQACRPVAEGAALLSLLERVAAQ